MGKNNIKNNTVTNANKNKKIRSRYVSKACNNCKKLHRKCSEGNHSCNNCLRRKWKCSKDILIVQPNNDNNNSDDVGEGKN